MKGKIVKLFLGLCNKKSVIRGDSPDNAPCPHTLKRSSEDLLSHAATRAVPSALKGLTTVVGMGTGVSPSLPSLDTQLVCPGGSQAHTFVTLDTPAHGVKARSVE